MKTYDYIILGAGISGLSLVHKLSKSSLSNKKILIIDGNLNSPDHALAFWEKSSGDFEDIVFKKWNKIGFRSEQLSENFDLKKYKYKVIKTIDFYNFVKKELARFPNISIQKARVEEVIDRESDVEVQTTSGTCRCLWCFNSIFDKEEFKTKVGNRKLSSTQYFTGWEIKTSEVKFDPAVPVMFDLRIKHEEDFRFFYVLPYSNTSALIEFVHLDPTNATTELKKYISEVLGIKSYEIVKREGGTSPLTNYGFPRKLSKHVVSIGIKGGQVKPSSGYVFTRIQKDSHDIINSLIKYDHPFNLNKTSWFYQTCDSTFLDIFENNPKLAEEIFINLFKHYPADKIFKFLDEKANLFDKFLMGCSFLQLKGETRKIFFKTLLKNVVTQIMILHLR